MATLSELLTRAIGEADTRMKTASASDAIRPTTDPLEVLFNGTTPTYDAPASAETGTKVASAAPVIEGATKLAEEALHFAECLDVAAGIVEKLAESVPETLPATETRGLDETMSVPKPSGSGAPSTAPHLESQVSVQGVVNNNAGMTINPTGPTGAGPSKTASLSLIRAKLAQAEVLKNLGQVKLAEDLLASAEAEAAKLAQDPSSPQPVINAGTYKPLSTDVAVPSGPGSVPSDNAGAISLTQAQARDASTRAGAAHTNITPARDPMTNMVEHGEVAKISAANANVALSTLLKTASAGGPDAGKAGAILNAFRATPGGAHALTEV